MVAVDAMIGQDIRLAASGSFGARHLHHFPVGVFSNDYGAADKQADR